MRLSGVTILATACGLLLVACGQKGPLTLPPPPAAEQSKRPERPSDRSYPAVPSTSEKK
jgi:predicted small lipoprotein YifL